MKRKNGKNEKPLESPHHRPAPVDLAEESVAGEEDPGAAMDSGESSTTPPKKQTGGSPGRKGPGGKD